MSTYKIVDADELDRGLSKIGNAIREKTGGSDSFSFPDEMETAVRSISIEPIPDSYVDTTSTTPAGVYDIFRGKTAFVNGEMVTGDYRCVGLLGTDQWSANSTNCSSSQLVIPCDFQPLAICIILNSGTFTNNKIFSVWAYSNTVQYLIKTSSGNIRYVVSGNYYTYDSTNRQLIFNQYSDTYNWSTQNYKVFLFR